VAKSLCPQNLLSSSVKGAFLAVAVSTYVDGFGTGIVGIDLQLPNKKAKTVIKIMEFKNFMVY
jgi:hypothetical protein